MDQLSESCNNFLSYPTNLIKYDELEHNLSAYLARLIELGRPGRTLSNEDASTLDILDLDVTLPTFRASCLRCLEDLKDQLKKSFSNSNGDPICRFVFIHAAHSRAPLKISHQMFCFLFSYLQIMPSFLDFVFSFGNQEFLPDFHFTGFREESHLKSEHRALTIPQLGRSGSEMQLCYNLMSVEEFPVSVELPWSIRQVAVYHRLDFETGKSVWVTIKGNKVIKDRLSNLTKKWDASRFGSVAEAFTACLEVHLLLCNWSMANWRWYINDLQKLVQNFTRDSQSAPVGCTPGPQNPGFPCLSSPSPLSPPSRTVISHQPFRTMKRCIKSLAKKSTLSDFWKARERENGFSDTSRMEGDRRNISFFTQSSSGAGGPGELEESDTSGFGLGELQRIIFIEEKAQEVSKILQSNDRILEDLRQHYDYITNHAEIPQVAKDNGPDNIKFQNGIKRVKKELSFQQSSIEGLLRILEQRKGFIYAILQYRGLRASETFARKVQNSSNIIEKFGHDVRTISEKTKQETVSMKIITLVTLFFLPGTFVATFMSTDILKFANGEQNFQAKGLKTYLAISLPMMAITFLSWYGLYWLVTRGNNIRRRASGKRDEEDETYSYRV